MMCFRSKQDMISSGLYLGPGL